MLWLLNKRRKQQNNKGKHMISTMNVVRANFMRALELKTNQRPSVINREMLAALMSTFSKDEIGPFGAKICWPSWLTNTDEYKVNRGEFKLPWEEYDEFMKLNPDPKIGKKFIKAKFENVI